MFPIFGLTSKDGEPGLIGISGKAGSGKDTLGKFLCNEYRCLHYYFAKPLKEGAKLMFNLSDKQIENKEKVIEPWGMSPRKIYQLLGTEIGRGIDVNIWVKNAEMFVKQNAGFTVVITDVRFNNEAYWIHNRGGIVINVVRDQDAIDENIHSSEHGLSSNNIDLTISNNGTKEELYNKLVNEITRKDTERLHYKYS